MKGRHRIDPALCAYGAATPAIRRILGEWAEADWFVPPPSTATALRSTYELREHHALARRRMPEIYAEHLGVEVERGNWADFLALAAAVRARGAWDWKYGALKKLSLEHRSAFAWSPDALAVPLAEGGPRPEDFFFRLQESVIWNPPTPQLDLQAAFSKHDAEVAGWYVSYATMDVLDAIIWQLAEQSDATDGNPFLPLVRCYAAGYWPFGLAKDEIVLFAFEPDA